MRCEASETARLPDLDGIGLADSFGLPELKGETDERTHHWTGDARLSRRGSRECYGTRTNSGGSVGRDWRRCRSVRSTGTRDEQLAAAQRAVRVLLHTTRQLANRR